MAMTYILYSQGEVADDNMHYFFDFGPHYAFSLLKPE